MNAKPLTGVNIAAIDVSNDPKSSPAPYIIFQHLKNLHQVKFETIFSRPGEALSPLIVNLSVLTWF